RSAVSATDRVDQVLPFPPVPSVRLDFADRRRSALPIAIAFRTVRHKTILRLLGRGTRRRRSRGVRIPWYAAFLPRGRNENDWSGTCPPSNWPATPSPSHRSGWLGRWRRYALHRYRLVCARTSPKNTPPAALSADRQQQRLRLRRYRRRT